MAFIGQIIEALPSRDAPNAAKPSSRSVLGAAATLTAAAGASVAAYGMQQAKNRKHRGSEAKRESDRLGVDDQQDVEEVQVLP
ncbi:Uu.00g143020.m01.CDS01 [Anthostomella pinea]|uniref:Uu.00g143020.m01.CDS01 n=1 Tax=Anthostomella pinea TaxID=933095 RepID=A0AAI8VQP3_9PEZI|nr:Uu.00g143020.m01.CDS01 [Anthostomella pinea]